MCKSSGSFYCGFLSAAPIPQEQVASFNLTDPYIHVESATVLSDNLEVAPFTYLSAPQTQSLLSILYTLTILTYAARLSQTAKSL